MPRPSNWNSPTTSIRVPAHTVDRLLDFARSLDGGSVQNSPPGSPEISVALAELVERFSFLADAEPAMVNDISESAYRKRSLRLDVIRGHYLNLQLNLTGHETNEGCCGVFEHAAELQPLLLWMLLAELLAGLDRSKGGSVFQHERKVNHG